jgi:hypothetical protein
VDSTYSVQQRCIRFNLLQQTDNQYSLLTEGHQVTGAFR